MFGPSVHQLHNKILWKYKYIWILISSELSPLASNLITPFGALFIRSSLNQRPSNNLRLLLFSLLSGMPYLPDLGCVLHWQIACSKVFLGQYFSCIHSQYWVLIPRYSIIPFIWGLCGWIWNGAGSISSSGLRRGSCLSLTPYIFICLSGWRNWSIEATRHSTQAGKLQSIHITYSKIRKLANTLSLTSNNTFFLPFKFVVLLQSSEKA